MQKILCSFAFITSWGRMKRPKIMDEWATTFYPLLLFYAYTSFISEITMHSIFQVWGLKLRIFVAKA